MSDPTEDRLVRARVRRHMHAEDDVVPRLPRGKGLRLSSGPVIKIVLTAALLVMLLAIRKPCSDNVSKFVIDMDRSGSGSATMPRPGTVDEPAQEFDAVFTPDMTEAEIKAAVDKARAKHAAKRAAGSQAAPATGSGSAAPAPAPATPP